MKNRKLLVPLLFVLNSCALPGSEHSAPKPQSANETVPPYYETEFVGGWDNKSRNVAGSDHISGYKISQEMCGQGDLKFPRVPITTRAGYCVGIVAGQNSGLIAPRTIAQINGTQDFLLVDFGGWVRNNGRVILLKRQGSGYILKTLLEKLDYPHGLAFGPDGKAYIGVQDKIFRFNPLAPNPSKTVEVVIKDLPGMEFTMPSGVTINKNIHPLKQFVFDRNGSIYVNIGAPTDACAAHLSPDGSCFAAESNRPMASIWKFTPQSGKIFKTLSSSDKNPSMEVMATGLRNSVAMLTHPLYPADGYAFLQGENGRDFPDPSQPNEELNSIVKGMNYGWPYCYNNWSVSPDYKSFLSKDGKYKDLCSGHGKIPYSPPLTLFPPHSSPLDLKYYNGSRFPELKGSVLVTWHGYMPSGSRVAFAPVNEKGFPVLNTKTLSYGQNCGGRKLVTSDVESTVAGVQFQELITGWYGVGGVRPQGAPVGMTVADDGSIWVVEDKNSSILRIDKDDSATARTAEPCDSRSEEDIAELVGLVTSSSEKSALLRNIRKNLVERHCMGCHSNYNLSPEMGEAEKDIAVAKYIFKQDSWFLPGNIKESRIHQRTHALGVDRPMPGNAAELLQTDAIYRQVVSDLDNLIETIIPGEVYRVKLTSSPSLRIRDKNKNSCGAIPNEDEVLVINKNPSQMPGFMQIYKPAKKYLNGDCPPGTDYFLGVPYLDKVDKRNPSSISEKLFLSRPMTEKGQFTFGIEGPAVDSGGRLFAVNFKKNGTVGVVEPNSVASVYADLPKGSVGNAIAISKKNKMYIGDYKGHKIFTLDPQSKKPQVYVEGFGMSQPNDMVIGSDDVLYLTDPDWKKKRSRIWKVTQGKAEILHEGPELFNGIDLSSDEKFLILGDSRKNKIIRYKIAKELKNPEILHQFSDFEIDGLKVDQQDNIYVARIAKGTIAMLSPTGKVIREIALTGKDPTNLVFGGSDGKTIYVTQRDGGFIESFRVETPGRSWKQ